MKFLKLQRSGADTQEQGKALSPFLLRLALSLFAGVFAMFLSAPSSAAAASNIYISQNGGGTGTSCSSTFSAAWFNNSGNWGSGSAQIGPGTTVHLCGTFTGTAGGTMLTFQGSGANGNNITLFGETGAKFTAPYWSGSTTSGGAINTNGFSYITIDGGPTCGWSFNPIGVTPCNMSIVNTQNGTGLTYDAASIGIVIPSGSTYVEVKDTDCHNIYTHTAGGSDDSANYTDQMCVFMGYSGAGTSHITLDHNIFHDGGWLINAGVDYITIGPGNELYNADHDIASAPIHGYIYGNHFHDWSNWGGFGAHHDGFHCYAGSSSGASQVLYIYDNQFDGDPGATGLTGFVFLEGAGSSTTCFAPGATGAYLFNNVGILQNNTGGNFWLQGNSAGVMSNAYVANNTIIGNQPTSTTSQGSLIFAYTNNAAMYNNADGGLSILIGQHSSVSWAAHPDYNFYEDCISGGPCFAALGVSSDILTDWLSAGNDTHGGADVASATYFGLNSACVPTSVGQNCAPQSGSPLIHGGMNLNSVCNGQPNPGIGALCYDITGAPRPTTGAWDAGAYQYGNSGNTTQPNPPTGLQATVQ